MVASRLKRSRFRTPTFLLRWQGGKSRGRAYTSVGIFIVSIAVLLLCAPSRFAQHSAPLATAFLGGTELEAAEFTALKQGEPIIRLLPVSDSREIAVYGLVGVHVPSQMFLQSFRDSLTSRSNSAILEIGRFSNAPTIDDLRTLTMESRDIEDLKQCVVGDCQLKLSASMIERFRKEVDWRAPDYASQANQLFKVMLLEYVQNYLRAGDRALIEYGDKPGEVRLADEQRSLFEASRSFDNVLPQSPKGVKNISGPELSLVEDAIVWSKIKFGLKPVLAINHVLIYQRAQEVGPQILIASSQIYANHYFDSSLALTTFIRNPGPGHESYLVYENRSRVDGLGGMFGKLKRGIIEREAVASLKTILQQTRINLSATAQSPDGGNSPLPERRWRRWKIGGIHIFFWFSWITIIVALALLTYQRMARIPQGTHR
ncbi:MAG TPA: hypothetical protein VGO56_19950 [Pyrinomonadaceae bacterium]|nr:hypothetical protein [Pyrinomonadaceae bacterium]